MFLREIAPMAIFLAAAGGEIALLDLLPDVRELLGDILHIFTADLDALPIEGTVVVWFYEIKTGLQHIPVLAG